MKRTITTLLLVLLCLTPISMRYWIQETYGAECEDSCSDPVQLARMSPAILGTSSGAAVIQCDNDTDYIGDKTTRMVGNTSLANRLYVQAYTATCSACSSGHAVAGKIKHDVSDAAGEHVKICYWTRAGASPASGDMLVGCTNEITAPTNQAELVEGPMAASTYDVTCGSNYWIGFISDSTAFEYLGTNTTGLILHYAASDYTNIEDNLGDIAWTSTVDRTIEMWISVGQ